ncbi:MAG: bifunctional 5,10-methylenetetrahydrofolate dehydrogenase/5,10-methenyltetrahydrofolate cyclohydrolase [Planctomycetota bacterium]|jgi:methylenetetrahydrofolate dehydrogenase (NADP+)/methenyltetrahydrofolate cyclohydrolase
MGARVIDGRAIAKRIRAEVKAEVAELAEVGKAPRLVAVQVGENPASAIYLRNQKKGCEKAGIEFRVDALPADASEADLIAHLRTLGMDAEVTGIILQLPLPDHLDPRRAQAALVPSKDVEGVHPANLGMVTYARRTLFPCTALSVLELLESEGITLEGAEAVVVGHSNIVGKPAALLLMDRLATVTVCHIATQDLAFHTRRADIVVVAVGKPGLITADMVKPGASVIDIGINRVEGPEGKMITVGDVAYDEVAEVAGAITPVPGGAGPVTVAMLLRNTVSAARLQAERG